MICFLFVSLFAHLCGAVMCEMAGFEWCVCLCFLLCGVTLGGVRVFPLTAVNGERKKCSKRILMGWGGRGTHQRAAKLLTSSSTRWSIVAARGHGCVFPRCPPFCVDMSVLVAFLVCTACSTRLAGHRKCVLVGRAHVFL